VGVKKMTSFGGDMAISHVVPPWGKVASGPPKQIFSYLALSQQKERIRYAARFGLSARSAYEKRAISWRKMERLWGFGHPRENLFLKKGLTHLFRFVREAKAASANLTTGGGEAQCSQPTQRSFGAKRPQTTSSGGCNQGGTATRDPGPTRRI